MPSSFRLLHPCNINFTRRSQIHRVRGNITMSPENTKLWDSTGIHTYFVHTYRTYIQTSICFFCTTQSCDSLRSAGKIKTTRQPLLYLFANGGYILPLSGYALPGSTVHPSCCPRHAQDRRFPSLSVCWCHSLKKRVVALKKTKPVTGPWRLEREVSRRETGAYVRIIRRACRGQGTRVYLRRQHRVGWSLVQARNSRTVY